MPIREKPIKWDGDEGNGRYRNVDGFKYDIIRQSVVCEYEQMPKHFLADTPEEAEKLYEEFSSVLNSLSYAYSVSTGIDKSDLFGEALIGLGRAYRDYDSDRDSGDNFKYFAIRKIKDALNECMRKNIASVTTPNYIQQAHQNIKHLKNLLHVDYLYNINDIPCPKKNRAQCLELIELLGSAAKRANITLEQLIERAEFVPSGISYDDKHAEYSSRDDQEDMFRALSMEKLLDLMDETEKSIAEGIMAGKTYEEIGRKHNKTDTWVIYKLKKFKKKLESKDFKREDL